MAESISATNNGAAATQGARLGFVAAYTTRGDGDDAEPPRCRQSLLKTRYMASDVISIGSQLALDPLFCHCCTLRC